MKVGIFRGGCLTGASHSGVELHGFLSYLVHVAVYDKPYTIFGYKGKQVRDQIESTDVIRAFEAFANNPRPGEVYNLGGGRDNAASVLECIALIEEQSKYRVRHSLSDTNRVGDHICYISDLRKLKSHFPDWRLNHEPPRYHRHDDRNGSIKESRRLAIFCPIIFCQMDDRTKNGMTKNKRRPIRLPNCVRHPFYTLPWRGLGRRWWRG